MFRFRDSHSAKLAQIRFSFPQLGGHSATPICQPIRRSRSSSKNPVIADGGEYFAERSIATTTPPAFPLRVLHSFQPNFDVFKLLDKGLSIRASFATGVWIVRPLCSNPSHPHSNLHIPEPNSHPTSFCKVVALVFLGLDHVSITNKKTAS